MKNLLKKLILWALDGHFVMPAPVVYVFRVPEEKDTPASPQMIDIRVPKKLRK